jgi:hypothetical protein
MLVKAKDLSGPLGAGPIDDATAEALARETDLSTVGQTFLSDPESGQAGMPVLQLRTLLAAMLRSRAASTGLRALAAAFESKMEGGEIGDATLLPYGPKGAAHNRVAFPISRWSARRQTSGFLETLTRVDPALGAETRRRITTRLADWVIEYHLTDSSPDFELRTRATFDALLAGTWEDAPAANVANGLDGAFHCAVERLTRVTEVAKVTEVATSSTSSTFSSPPWLTRFLDELTPKVARLRMPRRLTRETLDRIAQMLGAARRQVFRQDIGAALAFTALEEAVHRPHRRQLEHAPVELHLELPGPRGFGRENSVRLRVFDISRDGCLAVTEGPAAFNQTAASPARLDRAGGRSFTVNRLSGVLRQGSLEWDVRPDTALVLHDASRRVEWAAIDGASVVRVQPDRATNRLWVGFHFDRVVPEVKQEIEALVYAQ